MKFYSLILVACLQSCTSTNSISSNTQKSIPYEHKTWYEIPKTTCEYDYEDHDIIARLDTTFRKKYVLGVDINGFKLYKCDICKFLKEFKAKPFKSRMTWDNYKDANNIPRNSYFLKSNISIPKPKKR